MQSWNTPLIDWSKVLKWMEEKYKVSSITHIIISVATFNKSFWKVSDGEASPHSKFDFPFTLYFLYSPYMRQHQKYMLTEYKSFRLMYYAWTIIYSPFIIVTNERNIHEFAFNIKRCIFFIQQCKLTNILQLISCIF